MIFDTQTGARGKALEKNSIFFSIDFFDFSDFFVDFFQQRVRDFL